MYRQYHTKKSILFAVIVLMGFFVSCLSIGGNPYSANNDLDNTILSSHHESALSSPLKQLRVQFARHAALLLAHKMVFLSCHANADGSQELPTSLVILEPYRSKAPPVFR